MPGPKKTCPRTGPILTRSEPARRRVRVDVALATSGRRFCVDTRRLTITVLLLFSQKMSALSKGRDFRAPRGSPYLTQSEYLECLLALWAPLRRRTSCFNACNLRDSFIVVVAGPFIFCTDCIDCICVMNARPFSASHSAPAGTFRYDPYVSPFTTHLFVYFICVCMYSGLLPPLICRRYAED